MNSLVVHLKMVKWQINTELRPSVQLRKIHNKTFLGKIHKVISNLVCTFDLKNSYQDEEDPWAVIIEADAFVVRSTYHTMLQGMPAQIVFGHDIILNTTFICDK